MIEGYIGKVCTVFTTFLQIDDGFKLKFQTIPNSFNI